MWQHPRPLARQEGLSFPMASIYATVFASANQLPPIVRELEAIFDELPDEELLTKLRTPKPRGGRPGYDPRILWRCFIAFHYLNLHSVSDLIRYLHDNPYVANACGIDWPNVPSQPTFSRFFSKLAWYGFKAEVNKVFHRLTRRLYDELPDFGKSVAVDATDLKGWSNGGHRTPSDKDAGWVIKTDTQGRGKFTWGFKLTLVVDDRCELPLGLKVTSGNTHDLKAAPPALRQARIANPKFHPKTISADAGYSSEEFRQLIRRQYRAEPVIKVHPNHKKSLAKYPETPEFTEVYNRRQSVERVFARLKGHRRLNSIRVRGTLKVTVHCLLAVIVLQAQALTTRTRQPVRKAA